MPYVANETKKDSDKYSDIFTVFGYSPNGGGSKHLYISKLRIIIQ